MREIKFRAWYDNGDGMVYFKQFPTDNLYANLMQFTGLLDKNGKEIYEGDIVDIRHWDDLKWEVRINPYSGITFNRGNFEYGENNYVSDPVQIDWSRIEIIGNIYENPDLLSTQPSQE